MAIFTIRTPILFRRAHRRVARRRRVCRLAELSRLLLPGDLGVRRRRDASSATPTTRWSTSALFSLFALHHSLFARPAAKRWIMRLLPPEAERSVYVWVASAAGDCHVRSLAARAGCRLSGRGLVASAVLVAASLGAGDDPAGRSCDQTARAGGDCSGHRSAVNWLDSDRRSVPGRASPDLSRVDVDGVHDAG